MKHPVECTKSMKAVENGFFVFFESVQMINE